MPDDERPKVGETIAVLRRGTWLYDGNVSGEVRIVKVQGEGPNIREEDVEEPGHPSTDAEGYYFVAEFRLPSTPEFGKGASSFGHASPEEAMQYAELKLPSPVRWDDGR